MKKVYLQFTVSPEEKKLIDDQAAKENYRNTTEFMRKTLLDRAKQSHEKK